MSDAQLVVAFAEGYSCLLEVLIKTWIYKVRQEPEANLIRRYQTLEHWADEFLLLHVCPERKHALRLIGDELYSRGILKTDGRKHHGKVSIGSYRISKHWLNSFKPKPVRKGIKNVVLPSGRKGWRGHLQEVYDDIEEFRAYCDTYDLAFKLGYKSIEHCWNANPIVQGGINPNDYQRAR